MDSDQRGGERGIVEERRGSSKQRNTNRGLMGTDHGGGGLTVGVRVAGEGRSMGEKTGQL